MTAETMGLILAGCLIWPFVSGRWDWRLIAATLLTPAMLVAAWWETRR